MTILLPTSAVAFAAFCVWLAARIVNRRERWAKWTAVAVVVGVPVPYVALYIVLVEPQAYAWPNRNLATHRLPGSTEPLQSTWWQRAFAPLETAARKLRPATWITPPTIGDFSLTSSSQTLRRGEPDRQLAYPPPRHGGYDLGMETEEQLIQYTLEAQRLAIVVISTVGIGAVIFTAFCIWLMVRIFNRNERWAKWTLAVVVGLPVLYALSIGPACWYVARTGIQRPHPWFDAVYLPIGVLVGQEPRYIRPAVCWYGMIGTPKGSEVFLPSSRAPFGSYAREGVGWKK